MSSTPITLACIGGSFAQDLFAAKRLEGERMGARVTPFGKSQTIYRCRCEAGEYYLLLRHSDGRTPIASSFVNYRANIYALKDLGVTHVISWSNVRAVSHNYGIGQFAVVKDLIDETRHRVGTFFEHGALVELRQWPVFCPTLRPVLCEALGELGAKCTDGGTYLCTEGPRRETPAEVQRYANWGADLLGHSLVPETFLAKELQMCFAGLCLVSAYAETGSDHRPFEGGLLFGEMGLKNDRQRIQDAIAAIPGLIEKILLRADRLDPQCLCQSGMAELIQNGQLSSDFRSWFPVLSPGGTMVPGISGIKPRTTIRGDAWA